MNHNLKMAAAAALATGCGAANTSTKAATTHTMAGAASSSPPSCSQQVHTWSVQGGLWETHAIEADSMAMAHAAAKVTHGLGTGSVAGLSQLSAGASALGSDARTASLNPPPVCAGHVEYLAAMVDAYRGAQKWNRVHGIAS
jgi:hypothetical protein